jgi:hypothetical protein
MRKRQGTADQSGPKPPQRIRSGDRIWVRCHQIWNILVGQAVYEQRRMEYGELAQRMGYSPKAGITLAYHLGIIGEYCRLWDLPCLNTIVANRATGQPGDGVVTRPGKSWRQEQRESLRFNWYSLRTPTTSTFRKVKAVIDKQYGQSA